MRAAAPPACEDAALVRSRLPLVLSSLALIVALSGVGPADAARAVQRALFANNAGKLQGIKVAKKPRANRLLPLDANARFPVSVLPADRRGPRGPQGPAGPAGALANPYMFRAHKIAAQDTTATAVSKIIVGGEDLDPHGDFDPAASSYTAPVAGYYQFSSSVSVCCAGGRMFSYLGTSRAGQTVRGTDLSTPGISRSVASGLMKLAAGDSVQLYVYTELAQTAPVEDGLTFFSGHLVSTG